MGVAEGSRLAHPVVVRCGSTGSNRPSAWEPRLSDRGIARGRTTSTAKRCWRPLALPWHQSASTPWRRGSQPALVEAAALRALRFTSRTKLERIEPFLGKRTSSGPSRRGGLSECPLLSQQLRSVGGASLSIGRAVIRRVFAHRRRCRQCALRTRSTPPAVGTERQWKQYKFHGAWRSAL